MTDYMSRLDHSTFFLPLEEFFFPDETNIRLFLFWDMEKYGNFLKILRKFLVEDCRNRLFIFYTFF